MQGSHALLHCMCTLSRKGFLGVRWVLRHFDAVHSLLVSSSTSVRLSDISDLLVSISTPASLQDSLQVYRVGNICKADLLSKFVTASILRQI